MENKKVPQIPRRNKYNFINIHNNNYLNLSFETDLEAVKARTAACTYASLHKLKFVTKVKDKTLEVWKVGEKESEKKGESEDEAASGLWS